MTREKQAALSRPSNKSSTRRLARYTPGLWEVHSSLDRATGVVQKAPRRRASLLHRERNPTLWSATRLMPSLLFYTGEAFVCDSADKLLTAADSMATTTLSTP